MLLGQDTQHEEKGPLASIRRKWNQLEPKKRKTISLSVVVVLILVLAMAGWHSRKSKAAKRVAKKPSEVKEISLNTDLIEKSLFRQAQETINQQGKLIADIRREIAKIKAQSDLALKEAKKARDAAPARAVSAPAKKQVSKGASKTATKAPPSAPATKPLPPPPPPAFSFSTSTGKKGEPSNLLGGIELVKNEVKQESEAKGEGKKKYQIYLPPSFMEATLLSGLDAVTTSRGSKNPVPVLLRIKDLAVLPNRVKANLKGCFVLGEGKGNLATERVDVRLVTLSCLSKKGKAVIDQPIKGYVVDEDGKAGLRGIVAAKMGAMLARAALAGFLGGVGEGVKASATTTQTTALGTQVQLWTNTDTKNILRGGIGGGISEAAKELEKFYLELARQTLPIVQVGATKTVTVVISEGVNLEVKNGRNASVLK